MSSSSPSVIKPDVLAAIGNTPLIRLKGPSERTGCEILGKAEFMNPGQSVKDRAALYIVKVALNRGLLRPGGTVVEGTAGNTGHRHRGRGQCARAEIGDRHSRHAEPGEEGRAAGFWAPSSSKCPRSPIAIRTTT